MAPEALSVGDPRVKHKYTTIPGTDITYHYLLCRPTKTPSATILLLHGFPDLAMGWRYQVPYLLDVLNLQVILPDMLGYSQTSRPSSIAPYSFKNLSAHMAYLIDEVVGPGEKVFLGGHDWGGYLAWRVAMWHPDRIRAVFSLCVNFTAPNPTYWDLDRLVKKIPTLRYQQQFADTALNKALDTDPAKLKGFFNLVFGGLPKGGKPNGWNRGMDAERLVEVGPSPIVSQEIVEHYAKVFGEKGMTGPFNWYRTRALNYEDELVLAKKPTVHKFSMPAMLVMATEDIALPPELAEGQERFFEGYFKKETLKAGHWVAVERPDEINRLIGEFLGGLLGTGVAKGRL